MRQIKLFVIPVFLLLVFVCLITVFLPSQVMVSKTVTINADQETVAAEIRDFNNWKSWFPLFRDKNISVDIKQNDDTAYAILTGANQKKLVLILINALSGRINIVLSSTNNVNENYEFILKTNANGETHITWNVNTKLKWYPWKKLAGVFMDKIKGPQYEAVLQNLKTASENPAH
jgi:polyketide cyclase/dehydrase/lipid transport protein